MIVKDSIYGKFEINEPVLVELMNAPTVTRLKDVSQRGYPSFVKEDMPLNYSRYEHSVGTMLLLRKLGAGIEEQIAGLLHDVSHTAFSHVIDWLIGDPTKEDYQDRILKEYINKSELPAILMKHGFDSKKLSEIEEVDHFGLLEREAPHLCADRLDYSFRDVKYSLKKDVWVFIKNLTVQDGQIAFRSYPIALRFAKIYAKCQAKIWGSPNNVVRYYLISRFMKSAMDEKIITQADFHSTETDLIAKIRRKASKELLKQVDLAFGKLDFRITRKGVNIKKKFRYIDPEFIENGAIRTITEMNPKYRLYIDKAAKREAKGVTVTFLGASIGQ